MRFDNPFLPRASGPGADPEARTRYILTQQPLQRVLAFTGHTINDLVNDQIVKNKVLAFYKLYKQVQRSSEITELERWWNSP